MNRKLGALFVLLLTIFLTGCQSEELKTEAESFQTGAGEYLFYLPTGWESVKEYKKQFNDAAVFGAEDTRSRSVLFIRTQKEIMKTAADLKKWAEEYLTPYYKIDEATPDAFTINDYPCLHYQIKSVYKDEAVWLEMYFLATETEVLEILVYRPRESSTERQLSVLNESIKSLKLVSTRESTEDSDGDSQQSRGLSTEELAIQVLGSKRTADQLIIRFVFTNTQGQPKLPIEEWKERCLLLEGDQSVEPVLLEETDVDTELFYLQQSGNTPVNEGDTVECAVVYPLTGADQEILLKMITEHDSQSLKLNE